MDLFVSNEFEVLIIMNYLYLLMNVFTSVQLNVLDQEKQVLITENRNIAEENVNKEPEIVERKSRISELSDQGKTLCTSVQEKLQEISKSMLFASTSVSCHNNEYFSFS